MIQQHKELVNTLVRFEKCLHTLLHFHTNPFPKVCEDCVKLGAWIYLFFSTYTTQICNGDHPAYWLLIGDLPIVPLTTIVIIFAMLRTAAICRSPFDGTNVYDMRVKEEIDVQLFTGSLALYLNSAPKLEDKKCDSEEWV